VTVAAGLALRRAFGAALFTERGFLAALLRVTGVLRALRLGDFFATAFLAALRFDFGAAVFRAGFFLVELFFAGLLRRAGDDPAPRVRFAVLAMETSLSKT
jgi:hypothetical protein